MIDCDICGRRKKLKQKLDKQVSDIPEENRRGEAREGMRTPSLEIPHLQVNNPGFRSKLNECCNGIVGSVSDHFLGSKNEMHHHMCVKCGKRFPEEGSFKGDWENDDLIRHIETQNIT